MGKVAKPLYLVVEPKYLEWPEIEKLGKQGHIVKALGDSTIEWDLVDTIFSQRAWYMTPLHRKHLTDAIKQARLRRYGTIAKKRKKGDKDEENVDSSDPESAGC